MLHDLGGEGPPVLLLHGLMGRSGTWAPVGEWLARHRHVWAWDAAGHRGVAEPGLGVSDWTTERFVDELAPVLAELGPSVLWGHSMGGLHAWCLAARHPELVGGLVVEDMAVDLRGRTAAGWSERTAAWPAVFADDDAVRAEFGPVAGEYFLQAFTGGRALHGDRAAWVSIAEHWGARDHWPQWEAVRAPVLLLEGEHGVLPAGQGEAMTLRGHDVRRLVVPAAGHLVHAQAPDLVRGAVEAFLDGLRHRE